MRTFLLGLLSCCLFFCLATTRADAGAWTQPAGTLWLKLGGIAAESDEFYANAPATLSDGRRVAPGDVRPYDDHGRARQRSVFLEGEYGLDARTTLGFVTVWKELRYEDDVQIARSWGWGDPRVVLRRALLEGEDRISLRAAAKLPWGKFSTDLGRIPIGENQADLELGAQWGRSLGRPLSWVGAEMHRRFRLRDDENDTDPGDEWFGLVEAGWGIDTRGRVGLKAVWQFLRGDATSPNFFAPQTALARDHDQLSLAVMVDGRWAFLEVGAQRTLGSESYPVGWEWTAGISRTMRLGL